MPILWMLRVGEAGGNVDKSVDYYMSLPYTVDLKRYGDKFRASI